MYRFAEVLGSVNSAVRFLPALRKGMEMNNATNSGTESATWLQGGGRWQ